MSWFEQAEKKLRKFGRKLSRKAIKWIAPVVVLVSGEPALYSAGVNNKESHCDKPDKSEKVVAMDSIPSLDATAELVAYPWAGVGKDNAFDFKQAFAIENSPFWNNEQVWKEVDAKLAEMTLQEMQMAGFINNETFLGYSFSVDDFKNMQTGEITQKLKTSFARAKRPKVVKHRCLQYVRQAVYRAVGFNVLSPTRMAEDWTAPLLESGAPFMKIGEVRIEGAKKEDVGNIKRMDLPYIKSALVVIEGNHSGKLGAQPAGHVVGVHAEYDENGEYTETKAQAEVAENFRYTQRNKLGRRYGNLEEVLVPNDMKLSSGMVTYVRTLMQAELLKQVENGEKVNMAFLNMLRETTCVGMMPFKLAVAGTPEVPYRADDVFQRNAERIDTARNKLADNGDAIKKKSSLKKSIRKYARAKAVADARRTHG